VNELTVTTSTEFQGWPCLSNPKDFHTEKTPHDGSCRKGFCFYASEPLDLTLRVRDSETYAYLLTVALVPGFNLLSWCKDSVLRYGGEGEGEQANIPEFSLLFCCNGMSLTFQPSDPMDIDSPYTTAPHYKPFAYQLAKHKFPPSLTVLSKIGVVPSLLLLAKVAGGGRGLLFEKMTSLAMDDSLTKTTFHSLSNRIEHITRDGGKDTD
jgi:hypothetical protein